LKTDLKDYLTKNNFKKFDIKVSETNKFVDILIKTNVTNDEVVNKLTKNVKNWLLKNYLN
jgi:hypothetical protein